MLGLVLTAGGARGAYQAGVLKRIGEIPAFRDGASPFAIVTGSSAGAINGPAVAAGGAGAGFHDVTQQLATLWSQLAVEQVFRTDAVSLGWGSSTAPTRGRWSTSASGTPASASTRSRASCVRVARRARGRRANRRPIATRPARALPADRAAARRRPASRLDTFFLDGRTASRVTGR
jgi:Patatin-like phospholipase